MARRWAAPFFRPILPIQPRLGLATVHAWSLISPIRPQLGLATAHAWSTNQQPVPSADRIGCETDRGEHDSGHVGPASE